MGHRSAPNTPQIDQNTKVIRQDRHAIKDLRSFLKINGQSLEIINYSSFGVAVFSPEKLPLNDEHLDGIIRIENSDVTHIELKIVRQEALDSGYKVAFEVVSTPIQVEKIRNFVETRRLVNSLAADASHYKKLPAEFRLMIFDLYDYLRNVETKVSELERQNEYLSMAEQEEFESSVIDAISGPMHECIRRATIDLHQLMKNEGQENIKLGFDFFREQLKNLIYQSPFAKRSYHKPLGYAGDFEMMNMIYRNDAFGNCLFGRCMERAMQMHSEPGAVRNRAKYLLDKLKYICSASKSEPIEILSIASGPAFEIQLFVKQTPQHVLDKVEFTLLDQDLLSLKSAQRDIYSVAKKEGKTVHLNLINKSIKHLIVEGLKGMTFDLVYSAGLFDYFSDSVAKKAGSELYKGLKKSGTLIIGNFNIETTNQFGMMTLFDWQLILRSKSDLMRLFSFEQAKTQVESEENEINLFCIIENKKSSL